MPIYEYECAKCRGTMEVMQKMSDPPPKKCENCGSKRVKRVMSQTSFVLKGEGWYITDYARKEQKEKETRAKKSREKSGDSSSTDSKSKDDSKSKSDTKSDSTSKPDTKSDSKKSKGKKKSVA